jgi:hypothetical protein
MYATPPLPCLRVRHEGKTHPGPTVLMMLSEGPAFAGSRAFLMLKRIRCGRPACGMAFTVAIRPSRGSTISMGWNCGHGALS